MTTKLNKEAVVALEAWCKAQKMKLIGKPRHVHPRCYVVGYAAPACLIVARNWTDAEPHQKEWEKQYPLHIVRKFDTSLKAGDWCIVGYVSTFGIGEPVAIQIPKETK